MKKVYLLILLCCLGFTTFATTWYSVPVGGDPTVLTNWWSTTGGTGTNPANFTTVGDVFIVQSSMLVAASATWTVTGAVIMNTGSIVNNRMGGGGAANITLNFYGPLTMNGSTYFDANPGSGTITINLYSDLTMTGTAYFQNNPQYTYVNFANTASTLAAPQHLSGTGNQGGSYWTTWTINAGVFVQLVSNFNTEPYSVSMGANNTFNVIGTLDCQTYNFNGPGNLNIGTGGNGGALYTANDSGINGSVICTGTNSFSPDGNYYFNGTAPQVTGTLLPANITTGFSGGGGFTTYVGTVTINNPAGVSLSQSTTFTNAAFGTNPSLTLTSGPLILNASNVIMGSTTLINPGFPSGSMVVTNGTGKLEKQFTGATPNFLYPVGDIAGNYSPITISPAAAGTISVTVVNTADPHNANTTDYLDRYWTIAGGGVSYTITAAQYVPGDVVGTEANISAGKYPAALPWVKYGVTNTTTHALASTAITNANIDFTGISTAGPAVTSNPNAVVCNGTPTILNAIGTRDGPLSYTWAPSSGLSGTSGPSVTATPSVTVTYTVTLTDGNGFKATATTTLTVNPAPGPILGGGSAILCLGQTIPLSDAVSGGTWSTSDPSAGVDAFGNVTANSVGSPFVIYTLPGGCNATEAFSIVSSAPPIMGSTTACTGVVTALTDAGGTGTWASSSTTNATVNTTTGVLTGVSPGNTVITYTLGPGCIATSSITVDLNPPAITGNPNACIGVTTVLSETAIGGTWMSTNTAAAVVSPTGGVTGVAAGATTIIYSLSSGCNVSYPMGVVELPPTITGTTHVCAGFSTSLHDSLAGGTWSSGNTALAVINPTTGVATGLFPGTPTIFYTLLPGCFTAVPLDVISSGTPVIDIAASPGATVCPGQTVYLSTTYTAYPGPTPTYDWIKDGLVVGTGTTYHYVPAAGDVIYSVMHSTFSCLTVDSVQSNHIALSVVPGVTPVVNIGAVSAFISAGANDTLAANVTSATPTPQYQWYKDDIEIPGATNSYYVVNENTPNNYKYNCTVNSGDACNTTGLSNSFYINVVQEGVKQTSANGSDLNIMPNPNNGSFTMNLQADNNEPATVTITNVLGEKVKELTTTTNTVTAIQLNAAAGVYFLSASTEHGRYVARIVVN